MSDTTLDKSYHKNKWLPTTGFFQADRHICSFADQDGKCFPSIKKLSRMTGFCENTVREGIKALGEAGIINRVERKDGRRTTSNLYTLMRLKEKQPSSSVAVSPLQVVKRGDCNR